mmetsp:Transcript_49951/g.74530  ORF Transcript_49951/g.74530 Transcript_49951/m.74530 type:complete len:612 (-) Transcript_49951:123-1958(-)
MNRFSISLLWLLAATAGASNDEVSEYYERRLQENGTEAPVTMMGNGTEAPTTAEDGTEAPTVTPGTEAPTAMTMSPVTTIPTVTPNEGINYYDMPELKWTTTLTGTAPMGIGNGFTAVGGVVVATSSDGTVTAYESGTGATKWSYTPTAGDGASTFCYSEATAAMSDAIGSFLVVPVFVVTGGDLDSAMSYVYALDPSTGDELYTSGMVPGKIQGAVVVTQNSARLTDGVWLVATHNTGLMENSFTSTGAQGHVSVWNGENGALVRTLSSGVEGDIVGDEVGPVPYAAIGIASTPDGGANWDTLPNPTDVMMWTSAAEDGSANAGQTLGFQIPIIFTEDQADDLAVDSLIDVRWNGLAPPALTMDASSAVFTIRGGSLRGWFGKTFNQNADWTVDPLGFGPVRYIAQYNSDETVAYVGTVGTIMAAIDTSDGTVIWQRETSGAIRGSILVSPDDTRVYSLSDKGDVESMDAATGEVLWTANCMSFEDVMSCRNNADGSLGMSDNGIILFQSDKLGNIRAVQLGFLGTPTDAPTSEGTSAPVAATAMPSMTAMPVSQTDAPSAAPSVAPITSAPSDVPASFPPTVAPSSAFSASATFVTAAAFVLASIVMVV